MLNNELHCSGPSSTGVTMFMLRWENANGRSGYMPKADRDWEAYLRAKDEDRKKVDRVTRKFRPLTDEVVSGHLVGDHTIGIYPLLQDETCWFLAVDFDKKTWQRMPLRFWPYVTQVVTVIRQNPKEPVRELSRVRWGLIPSSATDPSIAAGMINARSETASAKPAFSAM